MQVPGKRDGRNMKFLFLLVLQVFSLEPSGSIGQYGGDIDAKKSPYDRDI